MKVSYSKALSLLKKGGSVAIPTETVYGLAGRIDSEPSLQKIFQIKKRPFTKPLIVHCFDAEQAFSLCLKKTPLLEKLFYHFTPGPVTFLVEKNKRVSDRITAGKSKVALRVPQHPLTRRLLKDLKSPLVAPSANPYGKTSPVSAEHVLKAFHSKVPVLDGGLCKKGLESTIIEIKQKKLFILRPGIITKTKLENFLKKRGLDLKVEFKKESFQPGGSVSHYKPAVPFCIVESQKTKKEIETFLSKKFPKKKIKELKLFPSSWKTAQGLYSQLNKLSQDAQNIIYVQKRAQQKLALWLAIWDRLEKASSRSFKL